MPKKCISKSLTPKYSATLKYLKMEQLHKKSDVVDSPTHLLMDGSLGGMLYIPKTIHYRRGLFGVLSEDFQCNVPIYLIENRTDIFPFFIDLDFVLSDEISYWNAAQRQLICHMVVKCILKFYPEHKTITAIVCTLKPPSSVESTTTTTTTDAMHDSDDEMFSNPQNLDDNTKHVTTMRTHDVPGKMGNMHIHFNRLYVNAHQACTMCRCLILYFEQYMSNLKHMKNTWTDALDQSVYSGSGLRCVGSSKCMTCPMCRGSGCEYCFLKGKVNLNRRYYVDACYKVTADSIQKNGRQTLKLQSNFAAALHSCTIQNWDTDLKTTQPWKIPPGSPCIDQKLVALADAERNAQLRRRNFKHIYNRIGKPIDFVSKNERKRERKGTISIEIGNRQAHVLLQKIISYDTAYAKISLRKIKTNKNNTYYTVFVKGINANWCLNKPPPDRNHANHNIYFYATIKGLSQRCFCSCINKVRLNHSTCIDFQGPLKEWTTKEKITLFPHKVKPISFFEGVCQDFKLSGPQAPDHVQVLKASREHLQNFCYYKAHVD